MGEFIQAMVLTIAGPGLVFLMALAVAAAIDSIIDNDP